MRLSEILSERLRLWSPVKLADLDLWQRMSLDQEIKFAQLEAGSIVLRNTISILKGENERATKYIEDYEDDARKVLADECAADEKHCACAPALYRRIAELEAAFDDAVRALWEKDDV